MNNGEKDETPGGQFIYRIESASYRASSNDVLTESLILLERNDAVEGTSPQETDEISTDGNENQRDVEVEY